MKCGQKVMYTFTILSHTAKVYIIFLPDFIFKNLPGLIREGLKKEVIFIALGLIYN